MAIITTNPTGQTLILNRSVRFWLIMGFIAVVLLIFLSFLLTTALIRVNYSVEQNAGDPNDVSLFVVNQNGEREALNTFFGNYAFVPRSAYGVVATSSQTETQSSLDLPYFSVPTYNLTLKPQRQLSKIGSQTLGCDLTNSKGVFSYACDDLAEVAKVDRPQNALWSTNSQPGTTFDSFIRYKEGFLGIPSLIEGQPITVRYFVPGGSTIEISAPQDFGFSQEDNLQIITNTSNSNDESFILANLSRGEYLYFSGLLQRNLPKKFSKSAKIDSSQSIGQCAKSQTELACYYVPPDHAEIEEEEPINETTPSYIEVINLQNNDQRKLNQLDASTPLDEILITNNGQLFGTDAGSLYKITLQNDWAKVNIISLGTVDAAASGDSLLYGSDSGLFEYDNNTNTSYLKFKSARLEAPALSVYGDQIILDAFVNSNEDEDLSTITHSYLLTDKIQDPSKPRKEDFLPYEFAPPIAFMDYSDTQIFVALDSVFKTFPNGSVRIDEAATKAQANKIKERLQNDGLLEGMQLIVQ